MRYTIRHNGYTSQVTTTDDLNKAGMELLNLGFTCDRQTYGPDDSITGAYYHHKVNTHWTAEITALPTVTDLFRAYLAAYEAGPGYSSRAARRAVLARLRSL